MNSQSQIGTSDRASIIIQTGHVVANDRLCREHYRLTFRVSDFPDAYPGQFVHLCPDADASIGSQRGESSQHTPEGAQASLSAGPMLRRAFSIAGLKRRSDGVHIAVIYRVVGTATRWMATLADNDALSVLGPAGNRFPINQGKRVAWLVAGGVGLPPMLWLAEALHKAAKQAVAFCGAQSADLLPLTLDRKTVPAANAARAVPAAQEFARWRAHVVISTDDGSLGFHGHVGAAMEAYHQTNPVDATELVVYTCGPEAMIQFGAAYCADRSIECYACMERSMACGTGLCQSCVVPVRDETDPDGWSYRLCCTDGPVFNAADIIWSL